MCWPESGQKSWQLAFTISCSSILSAFRRAASRPKSRLTLSDSSVMQSAPPSSQNLALVTPSTLAYTPTRTLSLGWRFLITGRRNGSEIVTALTPADSTYSSSASISRCPCLVNSRLSMHAGFSR